MNYQLIPGISRIGKTGPDSRIVKAYFENIKWRGTYQRLFNNHTSL